MPDLWYIATPAIRNNLTALCIMQPTSIVSLVPSLTELLFDLGLGDAVSGRTRFCVHPKARVTNVPIVGGTKNPRIDKIKQIEPDLIIANKEENRKEDIRELEKYFPVLITEISTIEDALFTIFDIGRTCRASEEADRIIEDIRVELERPADYPPLSTAYFIWRNPWMSIGQDTYIHSVLDHFNFHNIFADSKRYPEFSLESLSLKKPDLLLLSSEPYPFEEKHIQEVNPYFGGTDILLVNGEWFSWYGSRMTSSFRQIHAIRRLLNESE